MSDTFNPQEILSRLRAKPATASSSSSTAGNGSTGATASHTAHSLHNVTAKVDSNNGSRSAKNMKTPPSLVLTATQRQENLTARHELEKEIQRLKEEITNLKTQNQTLQEDKALIERDFHEYRAKSEDCITQLRSRIARMALSQQPLSSSLESTGKVYPPAHSLTPSEKRKTRTLAHSQTHAQMASEQDENMILQQQGFRDPTFSELMRRSGQEPVDFQQSLRKSSPPATHSNAHTALPHKKSSPAYPPTTQQPFSPHNANFSHSNFFAQSNPPPHNAYSHAHMYTHAQPPPPPPLMSSTSSNTSSAHLRGSAYDYGSSTGASLHNAYGGGYHGNNAGMAGPSSSYAEDMPVVEVDLTL